MRFVPTSTGNTTAGAFEWYFDASDVGLSTNDEDIDAIGFTADGKLVISTLGTVSVTGVSGDDEDLLVFTATQLGQTTSGTWAMYFDGSDVGLSTSTNEDVNGVWIDPGNGQIYLTTVGAFAVTGVIRGRRRHLRLHPERPGHDHGLHIRARPLLGRLRQGICR